MPYINKGTHTKINKANIPRRPSGLQENYDGNWRKVSENYRRANPLCECCLTLGVMTDVTKGDRKGCVDHMVAISQGGSMYNLNNLLALCKPCHDLKSIHEKQGRLPFTVLHDVDGKMYPSSKGDVVAWLAQEKRRSEAKTGGGAE